MAATKPDRPLHHGHIAMMTGESLRLRKHKKPRIKLPVAKTATNVGQN